MDCGTEGEEVEILMSSDELEIKSDRIPHRQARIPNEISRKLLIHRKIRIIDFVVAGLSLFSSFFVYY
jgi:hypothetical protein